MFGVQVDGLRVGIRPDRIDGADTDVIEYRTNFCYNRTFPNVESCSWNYLPRLHQLTPIDSLHASTTRRLKDNEKQWSHSDDNDDEDDQRELSSKAPEEKIKFMILMQNGRVGSTWLVSMLNKAAQRIQCEGEFLDSNPCKNFEPYGHGKSHRWKKEGIAQ